MCFVLAACGLGADAGGGLDELPTAGLGPYGKLPEPGGTPAEEPYVVVDRAANLTDPSVLLLPSGGFRIWYTRAPLDGSEPAIYRSDLPALGEVPPVDPTFALGADLPWEQAPLRAPAAVEIDDRVVLFYQSGDSIGRATSSDGGLTWAKDDAPVLDDASDPSALFLDGTIYLYHTRASEPGIWLATSTGGAPFARADAPVLTPRGTTLGAFDRVWVGEPGVTGGRTATDQIRIVLFYAARDAEGTVAIGVAASRDGLSFERFTDAPILEAGLKDEHGPSALLFPSEGILFFSQLRAQTIALAVATSP
jgi:hypothetical protein